MSLRILIRNLIRYFALFALTFANLAVNSNRKERKGFRNVRKVFINISKF